MTCLEFTNILAHYLTFLYRLTVFGEKPSVLIYNAFCLSQMIFTTLRCFCVPSFLISPFLILPPLMNDFYILSNNFLLGIDMIIWLISSLDFFLWLTKFIYLMRNHYYIPGVNYHIIDLLNYSILFTSMLMGTSVYLFVRHNSLLLFLLLLYRMCFQY